MASDKPTRVVRRKGEDPEKRPRNDKYEMPSRVARCHRCKRKPVYHVHTWSYKGASPYDKYYCPECGQGSSTDIHTPDGQAHAALLWNDAQWKGKTELTALRVEDMKTFLATQEFKKTRKLRKKSGTPSDDMN